MSTKVKSGKAARKGYLVISIVIMVITVLVSVYFMRVIKSNARMETRLEKYMPENHPAFIFSDQAEEWFNIKDSIIIAIENTNGIYNYDTLLKIKKLTKDLGTFDEINKSDITSLYSADNIIGTEDSLDVRPFFKKVPKDKETLQTLREFVRSNEMVWGRLISTDETVALIIAPIESEEFSLEFYHELVKLAKSYEGQEQIYIAGRPIIEGTLAYLGPRDMKKMVPIVLLVIILVLFLVLRSFKGTFLVLSVVLFSVIWTFGIMTLFNIPIYAISTMIPVMLIAIGVADGIHLINDLMLNSGKHKKHDKLSAIKHMLVSMWKPVVMTSVTTAVGFISLLTSEVYPIKYFGIFTAIGVMLAMVFSLTIIPAGFMVFGLPKIKPNKSSHNSKLGKLGILISNNQKVVFIVTIFFILLSIYGLNKVWINSSFLDKFSKDSEIVKTDEFINRSFGGTTSLNLIFQSDQKNIFKNPEVLENIVELQNKVEKLKVVGNSFSLTDYILRMNKVMNSNKEEFYTIPDDKNLIAQYLLLYEMSGDPANLWKVVNYDYNKLNLTFQLKSDNSKEMNKAIDLISENLQFFKDKSISVKYAGSGYKGLVFVDLILEGQIKSIILSILIIFILLSFIFKSIKVGLIGSVPIVITTLLGIGFMGIAKIPLSSTTALLSSIAVGIGVDYAIHFIERFQINSNLFTDRNQIIIGTMEHSGRAIIFNAVVVIAGFSVLLFSVFPPNRALGGLVAFNMFTSFLGTITVMLVLLNKLNKKKEEKDEDI